MGKLDIRAVDVDVCIIGNNPVLHFISDAAASGGTKPTSKHEPLYFDD